MPNKRFPRSGSMQFWPRKKAKRLYPKKRSWNIPGKEGPLGFAAYKVGMTHIMTREKHGRKMENVFHAVTILECPQLKVASIRLYKEVDQALKLADEIMGPADKELKRKLKISKNNKDAKSIKPEDFDDLRINVYTQPKFAGFGKKKPELFELGLAGSKEQKLAYAVEHLGKDIAVSDVFEPGQQIDVHAVTRGKGYQGPVKRFGIHVRAKKSEKTKRGPGSLGGWIAQGHSMYRIAHAGQMGQQPRIEYNKWLLKIGQDPKEIMPKGDFIGYGKVKNTYIMVKGTIQGPKKRLIRMYPSIRSNKKIPGKVPDILHISTESHQGN